MEYTSYKNKQKTELLSARVEEARSRNKILVVECRYGKRILVSKDNQNFSAVNHRGVSMLTLPRDSEVKGDDIIYDNPHLGYRIVGELDLTPEMLIV